MIASFFGPPFTGRAAPQFFRSDKAEQITGPPAKVSGISPANGDVNQQLDVYLAWDKPSMARRYDVYFGDSVETLALASAGQTARVYVPAGLELGKTYFSRIDAVNEFDTTTGDVCSFSTWAADDIMLDEPGGNPVTDDQGNYIDTRTP